MLFSAPRLSCGLFDMSTTCSDVSVMRRGVLGGARLCYTSRADGQGTSLTEQWVRPPLHMTKAYHEEGWAISQLMSPTAGLLDGDLLEVKAEVGAGAKAALISPAACRVHTMPSGNAQIQQSYTVGADAALDVWPAPLILQSAATLKQTTHLEVDRTATVLMCEVVSPGRVTFGECFQFTEWSSKLRITRNGRLLAYENFTVFPAVGDCADWRAHYPNGTYASLYYLTPQPLGELVQSLHGLELENATVGASPLREGGLGLKILAADGISLRKAIFSVRNLLILHSNIVFPTALKRAQTFFY